MATFYVTLGSVSIGSGDLYTGLMRHFSALSLRLPLRPVACVAMLIAAVALLPGCVAPQGDIVGGIRAAAAHQSFNFVVWELRHAQDILDAFSTPPPDPEAIDVYFDLADRLREAESNLLRVLAVEVADSPAVFEAEAERDGITSELEAAREKATSALRNLVAQAMRDEGLLVKPPVIDEIVFPPVSFVMESLPRVLVVSPRERIDLLTSISLEHDISLEEITNLEEALRAKGLSAYVERIGGLGTYPALVKATSTREFTIETIAHEWVHQYLFFRPLGQAYGAGGDMTAINETVANMVGAEVAARALGLPRPVFRLPDPSPDPDGHEADPAPFDFGAFMRETRMTAEELLADGRIDEAEAYMEARRIDLAEHHGYFIRKLNQAYFAFHGSYADQPSGGSVSPIFSQLIQVRNGSPSLAEFLRTVQEIERAGDLAVLAEAAEALAAA